jgi:glycosyltransferase involved in cell wall biosynthesis
VSVVIPAHNEEAVLPATLRALLEQDFAGVIDIVVVANGCSDDTVAAARAFEPAAAARGYRLRVIDIEEPGKPGALNAGDQAKCFGPTVYLDADVVLSANAVQCMYEALRGSGAVPLASPRLCIAPSRSLVTRAYGRVWSRIPYIERRVRGIGCYGVSAEGRRRWGEYPTLLADDRFARLHFNADEQRIVDEATYRWPLPEGLRELVRVRARWLLGNDELRRARPDLSENDEPRYAGLFRFILANPRLWPDVAVFVGVYGAAYVRMMAKRRQGDHTWDRATRAREIRAAA